MTLSIANLCKRAKGHLRDYARSSDAAQKHAEALGRDLIELRKRGGKDWLALAEKKIGLKRTQCFHFIAVAGGKTTVEEHRTKAAQWKRDHDARKRDSSPLRNGLEDDADEAPAKCNANPKMLRRERFLNVCRQAEELASFEDDLRSLTGYDELAQAAGRVVDAWMKTAAELRRQDSKNGKIVPHARAS